MSARSAAIKLGVFAAVCLALLLLLMNTMSNQVGGPTHTFHAEFSNVSGLRTGDDIRIAGVKVGRVDAIELHGSNAVVTFSIAADQDVRTTTEAVVRYQNLLGQRYILLTGDGAGAAMPADATIPLDRTSPGFDLTTLLNGFRPLFAVLSPAAVNQLSESVIKVLQGEGGSVADLLAQTTRLTTYIADRDQLLGRVAANLTPVLSDLARQGDQIKTTVHELAGLVGGLARQRTTIGRAIDHLAVLFARTSSLVEETREPLDTDVNRLRQLYGMYVANKAAFEKALPGVGDILATLARTMEYRSGQTVYSCDVGIRAGDKSVTVGGATAQYSEVCR